MAVQDMLGVETMGLVGWHTFQKARAQTWLIPMTRALLSDRHGVVPTLTKRERRARFAAEAGIRSCAVDERRTTMQASVIR